MDLLNILRSGIAVADNVTDSLQATVQFEKSSISNDGYGTINYADPVPLKAIVDYAAKQVRTQAGILTVTRATIDLLDIDELNAATGGEGVSNEDRFTLPDGDTGPILDISGFIDAETGHPVLTRVMIG